MAVPATQVNLAKDSSSYQLFKQVVNKRYKGPVLDLDHVDGLLVGEKSKGFGFICLKKI